MSIEFELSSSDLRALNELVVSESSRPSFCDSANALLWPDEIPASTDKSALLLENLEFLELLTLRSNLNLGLPLFDSGKWLRVQKLAPNWPGFRQERCSTSMGPVLNSMRRICDEFASYLVKEKDAEK